MKRKVAHVDDSEIVRKLQEMALDHKDGKLFGAVEGWSISTDGRALVALDRDLGLSPFVVTAAVNVVRPLIAELGLGVEMPLVDLRKFAALPKCKACNSKRVETCDDCDGTGERDCSCHDCGDVHRTDCDCDDGETACDTCRPFDREAVSVCGLTVDAVLLRKVLDFATGDTVRVLQTPQGNNQALTLLGDGWRALIMALLADPKRSMGTVAA